ncbi:helix-turn-helix transcriptional regulator [Cohnella xylanilytica]|uniref:Helix-turn-helix transcriptional regulator n=1 Tax=Cohnella xylanilytica TaxID=557555 RepID=A0A841U4A5_9BACL|nr:helix-turn-helix transcriptional regulator [Cohnella xylanilytica]MBB6694372.1 helix-turn-helix transcriptional regulator [Cohnella xylanilytica]
MAKPKTKIEYLRKINFLSQKEVADTLGMSQQYYGRLEKRPEKLSLGVALELKALLKVNHIDDLLGEVS